LGGTAGGGGDGDDNDGECLSPICGDPCFGVLACDEEPSTPPTRLRGTWKERFDLLRLRTYPSPSRGASLSQAAGGGVTTLSSDSK